MRRERYKGGESERKSESSRDGGRRGGYQAPSVEHIYPGNERRQLCFLQSSSPTGYKQGRKEAVFFSFIHLFQVLNERN